MAWVIILRNDPISPAVVRLAKDEALRILETGEAAGARKSLSPAKPQPYYNSHLLFTGEDRLELQRAFFGRLLESTNCYLFNSGVAGAAEIKKIVFGEE